MDKTGEEKGQEKANEFPLNSHGIYPLHYNSCSHITTVQLSLLFSIQSRSEKYHNRLPPSPSFSSPLLRVSWFRGLNISFFTSTFLESSEEESVIDTAIFPFCITA
jgi:hypothetical protein